MFLKSIPTGELVMGIDTITSDDGTLFAYIRISQLIE